MTWTARRYLLVTIAIPCYVAAYAFAASSFYLTALYFIAVGLAASRLGRALSNDWPRAEARRRRR